MMKSMVKILSSLILICLSAQIELSIPITDVGIPFSLQSLVVFIVSAFLIPREALISLLLYLLLGAVGMPVFADGASGINHILGSSGGFLYGFLISSLFISYYFVANPKNQLISIVNTMLQATMVLFFFGIIHLAIIYGISRAFEYGFYPFWKMALLKALLASIIIWMIKRWPLALNFKA